MRVSSSSAQSPQMPASVTHEVLMQKKLQQNVEIQGKQALELIAATTPAAAPGRMHVVA